MCTSGIKMKDLACKKQVNASKDISKHYFKSRGEMMGAWEESHKGGIQALAVRKESKGPRREAGACKHLMQVLNHTGSSVCTAQLTMSASEGAVTKQLSKSVCILHSFPISLFLCCFSPF